ncbi:2-keto-4-pentenoate hydratase [Mycobacterium sp. BMJ-28]
MLTEAKRRDLASDLLRAERIGIPAVSLSDRHADLDVEDAYEIQMINIRRRIAGGTWVVGYKVGLSSVAMQEMMGVDEPDFGHLLDDTKVLEEAPVKAGRFLSPRVEVEIGVILARDLSGKGCTQEDVLSATAAFVPAIEIIDSRIKDWQITLCDTIADNASSGGWVLGEDRLLPDDVDIKSIDLTLERNGEVVARGRSDAVLGSPLAAVAWLAEEADRFGVQLKAGDLVLPGSCLRAVDARPGDRFIADFDGRTSVRLRFE